MPPTTDFDCGHACCDERTEPMHDHFLSPADCPSCQLDHPGPRGRERVYPTVPESTRGGLPRHRHEFHALSWLFGQYGRQDDVHVHSCLTENCTRVLIGPGRECDPSQKHHRESL